MNSWDEAIFQEIEGAVRKVERLVWFTLLLVGIVGGAVAHHLIVGICP